MKTNTTAKVILFPQQTKKGFPLKIRIIQGRKSFYIGLNYYLTENQRLKYWNEKRGELKKAYIHYNEVEKIFNEELKKRGIDLKKEIEPLQEPIQNNPSFSAFYRNFLKELEVKSQFGLLQKSNSVFKHLELFCNETKRPTEILFNHLDIDFLKDFQIYLIENKLSAITQRGYIEKIRGIVNKAIKENKFNPVRHPFLGFEFLRVDTKPKCLEPQQFKFLCSMIMEKSRKNIMIFDTINNKKISLSLSKNHLNAGLMFLFQYYTYGMRVSDLLLLKYENIYESGKRIKYMMFKTKNYMDIVLSNDLLDILFEFLSDDIRNQIIKQCKEEKGVYKYTIEGVEISINKKTEFYEIVRQKLYLISTDKEKRKNHIFPLLPNNIDYDKKNLFSKISTYTAVYNKNLKDLSKGFEIYGQKFHLSSHIARHTFAYLSMVSGQSVYFISQALNHKSIKTTETYLRGFNSRQLDGKFYKEELTINQKKSIDDKLREIIANTDYEKKKKIVEFFNL